MIDGSETDSREYAQDYWFEDGDCVVQVERTLFKIHRFLFRRDESAFIDLFKLPQAEGVGGALGKGAEGSSPANSIVLPDKAEEFRALCWSMYSLALDMRVEETKAANIQRLIHLAFITNKYNFRKSEQWAMDVLTIHCQAPSKGSLTSICLTCSASTLEALIELCVRCGRQKLRLEIEKKWLKRLSNGELPVLHALEVGERLRLDSFLGQAYYDYAIKAGHQPASRLDQDATALEAPFSLGPDLPIIHRLRLNVGLVSLMFVGRAIEEGLQRDLRAFPTSPGQPTCTAHGHQKNCIPVLEKALKVLPEFNKTSSMTDVIRTLDHLIKKCSAKKGEPVCGVISSLENTRSKIQKALGEHFQVRQSLESEAASHESGPR